MDFLKLIISPGMFPYTVLLGLVALYWLVVVVGLLDIDALDVFDFGDFGEAAEGAAEAIDGASGVLPALMGYLSLGQVPVTAVLSLLIVKMWFLAFLMVVCLPASLRDLVPPLLMGIVGFVAIFLVAVVLTGLTTRPLRRVFATKPVRGHSHLIGQICRIKSYRVTKESGQAELRVRNSFLLLDVRVAEEELNKGDEAVIVSYDEERDLYDVRGV